LFPRAEAVIKARANGRRPYDGGMKWVVLLAGLLIADLQAADKTEAKRKAHLTSIRGIDEAIEAKLNAAGINNVNDLLAEGATRQGRDELAARSGLSAAQILKFVGYADLFRIRGISGQSAALLEAVGVNSVAELAGRNAASLQAKLQEANNARKATTKLPTEQQLAEWIDEGKSLPKIVAE
jgi:predicted flap endonuclease-1-like 5' DNA nuclease